MGDITFILPEFRAPAGPLADALTQDQAIAGFLTAAREHLGVEIGFIARWVEGEMREITHVDSELDVPIGPGFRQAREETYCWQILQGNLPELIADTADHPLAQQLHITEALPVGCHLGVPLKLSDGTVWGSFSVMGRQPDQSLNPRDLSIFKGFAGMAIERVEAILSEMALREQTRHRIEEMFDGHAVTIFQQPIHALDKQRPVGLECLARFPDINKRGPGAWFEDAEATGLGTELEMTAIRAALETLEDMPENSLAAIKAPARTILSGALREALPAYMTSNLVITLTQHHAVKDLDLLETEMSALRETAKIAIDAVGTTLDGMQKVARLKPDFIKLDMALTRAVEHDPAARAMVAAAVELARTFGSTVIAEGVEESGQAAAMQGLGVNWAQGYLFSRPLPEAAAKQYWQGIMG